MNINNLKQSNYENNNRKNNGNDKEKASRLCGVLRSSEPDVCSRQRGIEEIYCFAVYMRSDREPFRVDGIGIHSNDKGDAEAPVTRSRNSGAAIQPTFQEKNNPFPEWDNPL
jgi:hypothetical protein